jgi:MBG domain (YGX type)/Kelch motif
MWSRRRLGSICQGLCHGKVRGRRADRSAKGITPLVTLLEERTLLSQQPGTWANIASLPNTPDGGYDVVVAATGSDGRIYAIGGGSPGEVDAYNPTTNSWSQVASSPSGHTYGAAVAGPGGIIYAVGGEDATYGTNGNRVMDAYSPTTNSWTSLASEPAGHYGGAAAAGLNGLIYVIGGTDGVQNPSQKVDAYNPSTNTWTAVANLPTARFGMAAATGPDGRIYAIGGFIAEPGVVPNIISSEVDVYSPTTNSWTVIASLPVARGTLSAVTGPDGHIYALGGGASTGYSNEMDEYTPATNTWATVASLPSTRDDLGVAIGLDGRVYAIGGNLNAELGRTGEADAYVPFTPYLHKVTPIANWANPSDIVYGAAIGQIQLDPIASVLGTFSYTPATGTVLTAGSGETLSATFTPTDTADYNVVSVSATINVLRASPPASWPNPANIVFGTALSGNQLNATASVPGTFTYTPPVGTVLNAGSGQTLTVTFTPTDATDYNNVVMSTIINVAKATPGVSWPNPADIVYGTALGPIQLDATASVPGTFTYTPPAGTVLNAGSGQTLSSSFTPTDTTDYNNVVMMTVINVAKATPGVSWPSPANIIYGTVLGPIQLDATSSIPGSFTYTPIAGTLLNAGMGLILSASFTPTDITDYSVASSSTVINVLKASPAVMWPTPADTVYGSPLIATQLDATASVPGSFTYSPPAGTVLNAGFGQTLSSIFTPSDAVDYNVVAISSLINVLQASPTVSWPNPADIVYGSPLSAIQLDASASVPGTFLYNPGAGAVLNAATGQTISATFTPMDTTDFTNVIVTSVINVAKATSVVSWSSPANIVYGTVLGPIQLDATSSIAGSFTYTPIAGTLLNAGMGLILSASFTPTDITDYSVASSSATINVLKASPAVMWPTPADIIYGSPLGAIQLDATASVPGTFTYIPPAGTVLNAGFGQTLSSIFTPTDSADYNNVVVTTAMNVGKAPLTITAGNTMKLYGAGLPALFASYTGFVNGDTSINLSTQPILSTTASPASHVGSYPISASGAVSNDYTISYVVGTLSVSPALLIITANDTSKLYGAGMPALSADYIGLVNGDTLASLATPPVLSTTATASSHVRVGGYAIVAAGASDPDYTVSYQPGSLVVTPVPLILTAKNAIKVYGAVLPALSATYSGFVNGDAPANLASLPSLGTTATPGSQVGSWVVYAIGAASNDYTISYIGGTLIVTPATLTITADNTSMVQGMAVPPLSISYNGFVNGDSPANLATQPIVTTPATQLSPAGTYSITAAGASSPDYAINYASGVLVVTPASVRVLSVSIQSVRLGKSKKKTQMIVLQFSGALNAGEAQAIGTYRLTTIPSTKKQKSKALALSQATYEPGPNLVRLVTRKPLVLNPSLSLTINAAGLLDSLGRALDGNDDGQPGGNFGATLSKRGVTIA